jgi:hypothetical protein
MKKCFLLLATAFTTVGLAYGGDDFNIRAGDTLRLDTMTSFLQFTDERGKIAITIEQNGQVKFGEGFTGDEASRLFWLRVGQMHPELCKQQPETDWGWSNRK